MQTPGRQVESQTPMIAINRRVNTVFERLSKVEEDIVEIERPQQRMFGRILGQFQTVNNSMETMEDLIRQDIAAKRKYFREETKILEKDSRNLQRVNAGFGRQLVAGALGAFGISQILGGNFGDGATSLGGAAALLSPEILGVITTFVTTKLATRGLLNTGSVSNVTRVTGASKFKNPLLMTAALAASLILPGLMNNQNADKRRQESATRSIRGEETINKPDVIRFRSILERFDNIISSISLDNRRKGEEDTLDNEDIQGFINERNKRENQNKTDDSQLDTVLGEDNTEEDGGFFEGIKNLFGIGKEEEIPEEEGGGEKEGTDVSMIDNSIKMEGGDQNLIDERTFSSTNVAMGDINPNLIKNVTSNLGDLSFDMINNNIANNNIGGGGESEFIDLTQNDEEVPPSSGFSAFAASPAFVSVSTKFESSSGTIDKFESATALGSGVGLAP
tara:strand:- start:372 stop:1718 length:1347 start_codon:yes stop_codon:yes gene_type:complete